LVDFKKKGLAQVYRVIGLEIPYGFQFKCHGIGPLVIVRDSKEKCYGQPDVKGKALGRGKIKSIQGMLALTDYEADVARLNKLNMQFSLVAPDGVEFVSCRRIFVNGRLDCGGRHYAAWQSYPEAERLRMTIGGDPVVEIDLKAAHPITVNAYIGDGASLGRDSYRVIVFVRDAGTSGDRRRLRDAAKRLTSA
jgi:hypothetical protein